MFVRGLCDCCFFLPLCVGHTFKQVKICVVFLIDSAPDCVAEIAYCKCCKKKKWKKKDFHSHKSEKVEANRECVTKNKQEKRSEKKI